MSKYYLGNNNSGNGNKPYDYLRPCWPSPQMLALAIFWMREIASAMPNVAPIFCFWINVITQNGWRGRPRGGGYTFSHHKPKTNAWENSS